VDIAFDESYGIDHVKVMDGMGAFGRRVSEPGEIAPALAWATETAERERRPVLVEVLIEREANAAMGTALDAIKEWEPADASEPVGTGATVAAVGD
jgi:tartronate-semialdehyde synthase